MKVTCYQFIRRKYASMRILATLYADTISGMNLAFLDSAAIFTNSGTNSDSIRRSHFPICPKASMRGRPYLR